METKTMGSELQRARKAKRLRQEDVARQVGTDRRRVSDYERDACQPDPKLLPAFARVLGLSQKLLDKLLLATDPAGDINELFRLRKPRFTPRGDRPTWKRLVALWREDRGLFNTLWGSLGRLPGWAAARKFLVDVQVDSRIEVLAWIRHLLASGTSAARLALLTYGFRILPVINPETLEVVGDCRIPALVRVGPNPALIFPQATVLTSSGPARPDAIVGVRVAGGMRWCAVEYDGSGHDTWKDAQRSGQLRMPVVRFTASEVRSPGFIALFWQRVHQAIGLA